MRNLGQKNFKSLKIFWSRYGYDQGIKNVALTELYPRNGTKIRVMWHIDGKILKKIKKLSWKAGAQGGKTSFWQWIYGASAGVGRIFLIWYTSAVGFQKKTKLFATSENEAFLVLCHSNAYGLDIWHLWKTHLPWLCTLVTPPRTFTCATNFCESAGGQI